MEKKPSLNVVVPVYNEAEEIEKSITILSRFLREYVFDFDWVVTIADNASTDDTLEIARRLTRRIGRLRVVHLDKKGRGRAVKYAWQKGKYDVLAYMDVDLSTDLKHFPPLVGAIRRGYDIAIGSRNARGARVYGRTLLRTITSKSYIFLIKLMFWVHFSDAQCGFKAISGRVVDTILPRVVDNEWFFDTELLLIAEKLGYRIYEEPVTWIDNPGSTVRVMKTAQGDLEGLLRLFRTRPWRAQYGRT